MTDKKENKEEVVTIGAEKLIVPVALILVIIIISLILVLGSKKDDNVDTTGDGSDVEGVTDYGDYADYITDGISTSIDDDPYLGDISTAKFAIVEFSDYQCYYCYRHTIEVLPDILSTYVDTGEAIYVFRDLQIHGDEAEKRAQIGECVNEIAGSEKFDEYHEKMMISQFEVWTDEDTEVKDSDIYAIIDNLGVDSSAVKSCYESGKYADEIEKDATDANSIGITGTPGFVVGVLNEDGTVSGSLISGALPFEVFEAVVNNLNL